MTNDEIAALEALAQAATPGPWYHRQPFGTIPKTRTIHGTVPAQRVDYVATSGGKIVIPMEGRENTARSEDMAYIVAANPASIQALIRRLREAEADAKRFRWLVDRHSETDFDPEPLPNMPPSGYHSIMWGFWCHPDHSIRDAIDTNMKDQPNDQCEQ